MPLWRHATTVANFLAVLHLNLLTSDGGPFFWPTAIKIPVYGCGHFGVCMPFVYTAGQLMATFRSPELSRPQPIGCSNGQQRTVRITMTCTGAAGLSVLTMEHQPWRPGDVSRYPATQNACHPTCDTLPRQLAISTTRVCNA